MNTKEETKQDINSENNFSLNRELQVEMEQGIQWDCWEQEANGPWSDVPRASEKQERDLRSNGGQGVGWFKFISLSLLSEILIYLKNRHPEEIII